MPIVTSIEEIMDTKEKKMSWAEIANAAGVTKAAITGFRNGSELKFHTLLKIAQFLQNNNYMKVFKKWCVNLNQPKNLRHALEYLAINRQIDELEELIAKIRNEYADTKLLDWADGYAILAQYLKVGNYAEIMSNIRAFRPKTHEMEILAAIVEVWCRYKLHDFKIMSSLIIGLEASIDKIKESFIKDSYLMRLKEALAYVNLYKYDNRELARRYAEEIISSKISPTFTAGATYLLGMSYLFDDYDKCLGNILRHRELLEEAGRDKEIEIIDNNDIPFIKNIWRKHTEQPQTNDISEKAHYEATMGDKELAQELVNEAIEKNGLSGFRAYYQALATGEVSHFMNSLIVFVNKKGDRFYANLPYAHLKNDPVYGPMADLLLND
jgi:transcriptional regulator with XRE-family HTH domain